MLPSLQLISLLKQEPAKSCEAYSLQSAQAAWNPRPSGRGGCQSRRLCFLSQNKGKISKLALSKEFEKVTESEVQIIEAKYPEIFL